MLLLQAIPKLLWELGSSKPATSKTALSILHDVLRVVPPGSALSAALDKLQLQLSPLWGSLLDQKGVKKSPSSPAQKAFVAGPLAQLPEDCQVRLLTSWDESEATLSILAGLQPLQGLDI